MIGELDDQDLPEKSGFKKLLRPFVTNLGVTA
jgi:hypothetical protein